MKFLHRVIAFFRRKFWTSCPKCHGHFGGHQKHYHSVSYKFKSGQILNFRYTCNKCVDGLNDSSLELVYYHDKSTVKLIHFKKEA